ncbi:hypothetical protein IWQ60_010170 [Tieghemiomyces parasiticus]|uniref:Fungal lipase-type domain-containing protein n=1 Tax=Tieghemiomyces parasiticus TaxID=78921 RepID=A0A9W7ZKK9_9FUNG|nr:hypothetical protein IWQ60_010170 [Tieghemiomyces parasiticus]
MTFASDIPHSKGYLARNDRLKRIILAFMGTTTIMALLEDASFIHQAWPVTVEGSAVHGGFHWGYMEHRDTFVPRVGELMRAHPDYTLTLTGHSLGAAQAQLAAVDLALTYPDFVRRTELYAYGSPRVGNGPFVAFFNTLPFAYVARVTHKHELVPHMAPRFMDFIHINYEYWIREDDDLVVQCAPQSMIETYVCSGCLPYLISKTWLEDHQTYWGIVFDINQNRSVSREAYQEREGGY